jgi:uncharacterized membrane protein
MLTKLLFSSITLLCLDFTYLYIQQNWYKSEIIRMQGSPLELKWEGVILRYLTQIIGLNLFILNNNGTIVDAFIYGIIIYGNYIGTNYATIKIFDEQLAVVDLLKGGTIMALTTFICNNIIKK